MIIKCSECKREREVEDNIIMVVCKCGKIIELEGGETKDGI